MIEESVLKQFSEKKNKEKVQEFYEKFLDILTSALEKFKSDSKNATLGYEDTRIFPIGDYTNETFIDQTGELEVVVATSNPQIILSNNTLIKNLQEAKTKKERVLVSNKGTFDEIIINFCTVLAKYFDNTTVILVVNEGIKILCLKEYDFKVLLRFATYDTEDKNAVLNFWDCLDKNYTKVDLFSYNEKMDEKDKQTKGNYKRLVRIYKNLRKTILMNKWSFSSDLNKYFIELIVFNVPNSIMQGKDIKMIFIKSINYLTNANLFNFTDFDGNNIENFDIANISIAKIKIFLTLIGKII